MSTAKERINVFEDTMKWVKTDADLAASIVEEIGRASCRERV